MTTTYSLIHPTQFTILLVGYFVLGPSDLYKLTKEIGTFIQNVRTLGTDLTTTFENNMESQLQLEELRKAQRELNDAFSFRRSINVEESTDAFQVNAQTAKSEVAPPEAGALAAAAGGSAKKRLRRRKVVAAPPPPSPVETSPAVTTATTTTPITPNIPAGLEMPPQDPFVSTTVPTTMTASTSSTSNNWEDEKDEYTPEELAEIDREFAKYTSMDNDDDWLKSSTGSNNASGSTSSGSTTTTAASNEASRFQQQLAGTWNDQILAKEEQLEPLSKVMQLLKVLEDERQAQQDRLKEEFEERRKQDEAFYRKQRQVLEEAAQQVQKDAYSSSNTK